MIIGQIIYNEEEAKIVWNEKFLEECKGIPRLDLYQDVITDAENEYHWYLARWHRDEGTQRKKEQALKEAQDEEE